MEPLGGARAAGRTTAGRSDDALLTLLVRTSLDHAIFVLDVDGYVRTWNAGAARTSGWSEEEVVGQHLSVLFTPEDVEAGKPDRHLAIAAADGRLEDEGWRLRRDGSRYWALTGLTALRAGDGRLIGFGKVVRDLTERKQAEDFLRESEERFRLLVTAVADYAIFLLNPDGTVASWNLGAERLKGYRAEEIIGRHLSTFYTREDRDAGVPEDNLERALREGRWEHEGWRVRRDGSRFWADVVITALRGPDGQHRGFSKVTRDLTERKRNDDALRGILEREREAAARLREIDQMKSDFVAVVAHDLGGPVGVIQNMIHLLRDGWHRLHEDEKLDLLDRMARRTEALGGLVDDLFDLARIEAGQMSVNLVAFDVTPVVEQLVANARVAEPSRALQVRSDGPTRAEGDPRRTEQVLDNLLSNALKYSPPEAPVEVAVERVGDEVVVSVLDQGRGIPEHQLHLLFTRFGRLPGADAAPGSGMGLFIAKSLVEAQHGRLWVDSTPGEGSAFRFTLPAASEAR